MLRNLLMYILPVAGNGVWQWNVKQILDRSDVFTGRKIIAIAEDHRLPTDRFEDVAELLAPLDAELIRIDNNRRLREAAALPELLDRVKSNRTDEATFFCHAKGVTRGGTVQEWTSAMHRHLLDNPAGIDSMLIDHPIVGAFRRFGHYPILGDVDWHYAGTFYWFRHDATFTRANWRDVPQISHGAEAWPAVVFNAAEAGVAGADNVGELYDPQELQRLRVESGLTIPETDTSNEGVMLADPPSSPGRTIVIAGPARSGTTRMALTIRDRLGIPLIGSDHGAHEPKELWPQLRSQNWEAVRQWIDAQNAQHDRWAFKLPGLLWHLPRVRESLRDPLLIVMLRDPVAIACREHISMGRPVGDSFSRAIHQHGRILKAAGDAKLPTMLVSYEKFLTDARPAIRILNDWLADPNAGSGDAHSS